MEEITQVTAIAPLTRLWKADEIAPDPMNSAMHWDSPTGFKTDNRAIQSCRPSCQIERSEVATLLLKMTDKNSRVGTTRPATLPTIEASRPRSRGE